MEREKITVEANIAADKEKIWSYWTKPEHITRWNFASPDWQCPVVENDLRVGGRYFARMEAKDGSVGFDFEAVYDELLPQEKISYTMIDGRQAITHFEDKDGGTRVITTFDAEETNPLEMQKAGWQRILDNFKNYAESKAGS